MSDHEPKTGDHRKYWLDDPANVKKVVWAVFAVSALLFVLDGFYHKHPHFAVEEFFGFYAIFGFAAFFGIVIAGKYLRKLIMRREDYYDE